MKITDGFTETDEYPGSHWIPKIKFSYRPALSTRQAEWRGVMETARGIAERAENVKLCKEHLVNFDITDANGQPFQPTDDKVYDRIPLQVIDYMAAAIVSAGPRREAADRGN